MKKLLMSFNFLRIMEKERMYRCCQRQSGFITIITVLLMLVITTIIGISAISISMIESSVVRNDALYKRNLYFAESSGFEAAQRLENTMMTEDDPTGGVAWIVSNTTDMTVRSNWLTGAGAWTGNSVRSETFYTTNPGANPSNLDILMPRVHADDDIRLAAQFGGVASGSSLKITSAGGRLYSFNTYGMYSNMAAAQGESLIEMGYRKRF
jgi:Tfp pilus assembly protein PilX